MLASVFFTTILMVYESLRFTLGYVSYFTNLHKEFGIRRMIMGILGVSATILFVYFFVAVSLLSTRPWQMTYFFIFCFAIFVEYSSMKGYGRFTVSTDYLRAYYSDVAIWADSIKNYFNFSSLPIVGGYGLLLFLSQSTVGQGRQLFFVTITFLVSINLLLARYVKDGTFPTLSLSAFFRTLFLLPRLKKNMLPRQPLNFVSDQKPDNNIVLIVDESIRADHLSLNSYQRPTTCYLESLRQEGILYNHEYALAGANSSLPSNGIVLTGAKIGDKAARERLPSIFQYAKHMNYHTYFFDGWGPSFWLGKVSDLQYIDNWQNIKNFRHIHVQDVDHEFAAMTNEIINKSVGNFIWISKRGVHFDYNHNYPSSRALWEPVWQRSDRLDRLDDSARERLINSYDNAIAYNLDDFFSTLIKGIDLRSSTIIYTSDHGQTLGDDGVSSTHARQVKGVMQVPLFVISGNSISIKPLTPPSHENIFPTVLTLMKVPRLSWAADYSESLFQ
jgi:glucan phosphoethanolaminetransferase (alkaline phosphatase superfamily)